MVSLGVSVWVWVWSGWFGISSIVGVLEVSAGVSAGGFNMVLVTWVDVGRVVWVVNGMLWFVG